MGNYIVTEEKRKLYRSLVLLDEMINNKRYFTVLNEDEDFKILEPLLVYMLSRGWIQMEEDKLYVPTFKGRELLKKYYDKYYDYLRSFDIFCAVDLEEGEFAFKQYFEIEEWDEWQKYIQKDRWSDVRIAVAEFKKMDPVEIVFISFMNEKRFDLSVEGWQFDLMSDLIWDDVTEICNTAITSEQLGKDAMEDIVVQGSEMMWEILKKEKELEEMDNVGVDEDDEEADERITYVEVIEEVEIDLDYYHYYVADPYYVGPCWYDPWY